MDFWTSRNRGVGLRDGKSQVKRTVRLKGEDLSLKLNRVSMS